MDYKLENDSNEVKRVSAVATLEGSDVNVDVVIPLATANHYVVTLPPVSQCAKRIFVRGVRASGSYVDGYVEVKGYGDEINSGGYTSGHLTATNDFLCIEVWGNRLIVEAKEQTT